MIQNRVIGGKELEQIAISSSSVIASLKHKDAKKLSCIRSNNERDDIVFLKDEEEEEIEEAFCYPSDLKIRTSKNFRIPDTQIGKVDPYRR
ncbi:hypothetical protein P5673_028501 [Acropora cervicornis]|uniref:Uncharacterized protein n=1 Tax=Acropora cervicornis TaxID=6130 RepID=A0AAD9UUU8_ACRCE|nr:hypothetical protein P5673_028501 [Acropora cervicornis]